MDTFGKIVIFLVISFVVALFCKAYSFFKWIRDHIFQNILKPAYWIQERLLIFSRKLSLKLHIWLLALITLCSCIFLVISYFRFENISEFSTVILNNTTFISFINMLSAGLSPEDSINYPAMVSVCVSSYVSYFYMTYTVNILKPLTGQNVRWFVRIPAWIAVAALNLIFFCMSAIMAHLLTDFYASAAAFLLDFYRNLANFPDYQNVILQILHLLYVIIAFVVLTYAALASLTIVVQEYIETLAYGAVSIGVLMGIAIIFQEQLNNMHPIFAAIIMVCCFLIGELLRGCDAVKNSFEDFVDEMAAP